MNTAKNQFQVIHLIGRLIRDPESRNGSNGSVTELHPRWRLLGALRSSLTASNTQVHFAAGNVRCWHAAEPTPVGRFDR